ncbi:MAG TPA: carboxylesterase family protein [Chitinophagales bacterium]|nr:carboxylesterase family protein [Chitinophagales bacterium]HMX03732.1 carboxylesterase family protein [Chitinophagales bacterium]HMZ89785.1 carboxylesterase family protein [Chitinophagales bacterium]HNA56982.1 carboxylesterase family protein [Chitinophagales bacterium]HNE46337.1 carboxylesterase family protein [Chitinophagales bacterium]
MQRLPALLLLIACTHTVVIHAQFCNDTRFTEAEYFSDSEIETNYNVSYGLASQWFMDLPQPSLNTLDIAFPDQTVDPMEKRPLIVLVHGGGFWGGEKESFSYHLQELAKNGYVVAAINYRKGWMGSPLDCDGDPNSLSLAIYRGMQDTHAAIRFLVANADVYGIDTANIFAGGESAGVYAVMNAYYLTQDDWESYNPGYGYLYGDINASTNEYTTTFKLKGILNMWGGMVDTAFVSVNEAVPSIAFYGMSDGVIPPGHGNIQYCENFAEIFGALGLSEFYNNNNICNVLHQNPTEGHEAYPADYVCPNIACFIKGVLCNTCSTELMHYEISDCSADVVIDTTTDTTETLNIEIAQIETLSLFPNPADQRIQCKIDNTWPTDASITVYDLAGNFMQIAVGQAGLVRYADVSSLPEGVYLLRIQAANRVGSGSFVVARH